MKLAKWPTVKALTFPAATQLYGAVFLQDALARFIIKYRDPYLLPHQVEHAVSNFSFRFTHFPAFHRIKFILDDAQQFGIMEGIHDVAHARPERCDRQGRKVPARFDTVLVNEGTGGPTGVHGTSATYLLYSTFD